VRVNVNFLTAPGTFSVDLPSGVDPRPELSGVIAFDMGPRAAVYETSDRRTDPSSDSEFAPKFELRKDGIRISVLERIAEPRFLLAFWRLPDGYIHTHVDDQVGCNADLEGAIKTIVSHTDVRLTRAGLPMLSLREPLEPGDVRDPFQRDTISFAPAASSDPVMRLVKEPSWAGPGRNTRRFDSSIQVNVTTDYSVTVRVEGAADQQEHLERIADKVAASLRQDG
jgi:hypothetical protein